MPLPSDIDGANKSNRSGGLGGAHALGEPATTGISPGLGPSVALKSTAQKISRDLGWQDKVARSP